MILYGFLFAFLAVLYYLFQIMAIIIVAGILITIITLVYFQQNRLLYMPMIPNMPKSPSQNPSGYQHPSNHYLQTIDLQLQTEDNIKIRGWHVKTQNPHQLIIYFHQNAGNIGFRIPLIKFLSKLTNSDIILVAYRGYSDSDGIPSQQGLQKDAQAVVEYALKYSANQKLKVFLYGRSLGGAVSIYIGSHQKYKNKIAGLILQNTFTSISDMIDAIMPIFKYIKFVQTNHWLSLQRIPRIQKPVLFIRSSQDQLVPTSQMIRLIQNVDKNIYFQEYQILTGTHNCSWQLEKDKYFERIRLFLNHPIVSANTNLNSQL